jgi:hypothetical protein
LDCAGLCWIGPLALMGIMQWAASGGHPSNRAKAPPLAPSTWNRNPCWVVLRGQPQARARGVGWLRVEATYSFAQGASARFRPIARRPRARALRR